MRRSIVVFALVLATGTAQATDPWDFRPSSPDPIPAMKLDIEGRTLTERDIAGWWVGRETFEWDYRCVTAKNAFNHWMADAHDLSYLAFSTNETAYAGYASVAAYNASLEAANVKAYCNANTVAQACASVGGLQSLQMDACGTAVGVCIDTGCVTVTAACLAETQCESSLDDAEAILCP